MSKENNYDVTTFFDTFVNILFTRLSIRKKQREIHVCFHVFVNFFLYSITLTFNCSTIVRLCEII